MGIEKLVNVLSLQKEKQNIKKSDRKKTQGEYIMNTKKAKVRAGSP